MKTLHLYLTRQVLATLMMTVAVFTFVLVLGNGLKDILSLLINGQGNLWGVLEAFGLLIPWLLAFALPMGMLTAALLVFGRFSADQELTAVRSSGVSLVTLITPVLLLSLALCGLSAWINLEVAPSSRVAFKRLVNSMTAKAAAVLLPEGRYVNFDNCTVYVGRKSRDGSELFDVMVFRNAFEQHPESIIKADRGLLETTNGAVTLHLLDVRSVDNFQKGEWNGSKAEDFPVPLKFQSENPRDEQPRVTDMTFRQLQAELRRLEGRFSAPNSSEMTPQQLRKWKSDLEEQKQDLTMPLRVQMHRQVAFSFACFGFTLVGIPLGIRAHRKETNIGIAMALVLVAIYYSFIIVGQALQTRAEWAPHLIVWLPNFIFQAAGAVMLWRANRGI
jgi:lipopolysaccharide export system permease protein